jgi:hypothetical protein
MQSGGGIVDTDLTNMQSMTGIGALDVGRYALYMPDLEGAWEFKAVGSKSAVH